MLVKLAVDHLARGAGDGGGAAGVEQAKIAIGLGSGQLDDAERMNQRAIGIRSWPMRKFCRERSVCAPQ